MTREKCCCPADDRRECFDLRYPNLARGRGVGGSRDYDVCDCVCHDEWEAEQREHYEDECRDRQDEEYRRGNW